MTVHDRLHVPSRGRLKIFLGAAAGVGKTYAMLGEARDLKAVGVDVVIGYLEPHGRRTTEQRAAGLEVAPRRIARVRDRPFAETDVDWLLERSPQLCLVDELAHTNHPGGRHAKRWQDVEELLAAGIDVFTTVNIQHLESLNDKVLEVTGVRVRETFPDRLLHEADEVVLVDLPPEALRERVMVCIDGRPDSSGLVRRAARMARRSSGRLWMLHVEPADERESSQVHEMVDEAEALAGRLGATVLRRAGDVAEVVVEAARELGITQIVLGESHRPRWKELVGRSIIARILRETDGVDVHIIADHRARPPRPTTRTAEEG
ncbi:MAG TPA: universal stress protein [Actinomycetota bacterium]|nr:universal stress protein [Actinomycetota bacterium]